MQVVYADDMEPHMRDVCENTMLPCVNECGKSMHRQELPGHYAKYCPFRTQECALCGESMEYKVRAPYARGDMLLMAWCTI